MDSRRFLLASALLIAIGGACAREPGKSVSFATEDSTRRWQSIREPLAEALVAKGDKTDREMLDDTIKDEGLARNYRQFFRARQIRLAAAGGPAMFVRPASDPRYAPFYGAHVFRFWVVDAASNVLLTASADRVSVLDSTHGGMHDLVVSQCRAGTCYDTTEVFEGGKYRDGACSTRSIDSGHTVAGCD